MFGAMGSFIYSRRWLVLVLGLVFIAVSALYGTTVFANLKGGGFFAPNAESTKVMNAMTEKLGRDPSNIVVMFTSKDGSQATSPEYAQAVQSTLDKVKGQPGLGSTSSFYNTRSSSFVSNDKQSTYAVIGLTGDEEGYAKTLKRVRPLLTSDKLQVRLGGQAAVSEEISDQVSSDLAQAETVTFPILALLLVVIFGSLVAAALPLAIGGVAILGAFLILKLASGFTDVSVFAINVITMLGLGLAIDYSLFVVSRFREELVRQNGDVRGSVVKTMQTAGRTVMFSGLTVAISLISLVLFPQMFLRSLGMGGAAAVLVAMLATFTVLPALLAVLGTRVNSLSLWSLLPGRRKAHATGDAPQSGFWYRTSEFVMRHPFAVLILVLTPIILVGLPFFQAKLAMPDARSLPKGRESRVVSEMLMNSFPRNETDPIEIVVQTQGPTFDPKNLDALYDYTRTLGAIPGVTTVHSLVNTLDPKTESKFAYEKLYTPESRNGNPVAEQMANSFSKGDYSVVSLLYKSDPVSQESQNLVKSVRAIKPPAGITALVGGSPAYLVDFLDSLAGAVPWALAMIIVVIFVLLGSIVVPLKAVILNVLSLSASFGALVWIFQDGHLSGLLGFTSTGNLDATVPVLIFAIAFGLSMDYEVFLLSRIKEHHDRTGDTTASVALGVQRTGAIITSAAALLVVVIAGFATGGVLVMKEIAIGLGLAVLVDATLVRMLLVPATMRLLGEYNWWAPAPLMAIYRRLGLSETEDEAPEPDEPSKAQQAVGGKITA